MFRKTFQHILFLTLFAITTINAQVLDSALVVDSVKILNEPGLNEGDKPLVRYENGIKIVGEKTFDIKIEGGGVKQIIYTKVEDVGNCAYVVSENKIVRLKPNSSFDTLNAVIIRPEDSTKVFTHDDAIYVSSEGALFATTSTMILIIKSETVIERKYADRFGDDFPQLTHPIIREGNGSNVVDVRDDEFVGFKIQVLKTGEMEMKRDEK